MEGPQPRIVIDRTTDKPRRKLMNENKRKQIEAKLLQLFSQTDKKRTAGTSSRKSPDVVKVIRRRKGKPDSKVA